MGAWFSAEPFTRYQRVPSYCYVCGSTKATLHHQVQVRGEDPRIRWSRSFYSCPHGHTWHHDVRAPNRKA